MSVAPERIWVLAGSVVKVLRRGLYANERNRGGDTEYVRADLHAALEQKADEVRWYAKRAIDAEQKVERLEWLWAQAENLDPDLVDGAERAWAALEGREP